MSFFTGATGLEPAISGVTGQRDKPASLRPLNVEETLSNITKKVKTKFIINYCADNMFNEEYLVYRGLILKLPYLVVLDYNFS